MPTYASWIPLRWPSAWVDPALLGLLEGTPFNCLAMEWNSALAPVAAKARTAGLFLVAIGNQAARSAGAAAGLALPDESVLLATDSAWPDIASAANPGELAGPT